MFRKILVQLDPARPIHQAPRLALKLAERHGAELVGLYIVDEKLSSMMGGDLVHTMDAALGAVGKEALSDYKERIGGSVPFTQAIGYGDTADTIAKYVAKNSVDLVVTGGFHASVYQRIPFGSVVNEIIRKTQTSVLLYRDSHANPMRPGPIVVPHDGTLAASRALHFAAEFAEKEQHTLDVVHVVHRSARGRGTQILADVEEQASRLPVPVATHLLKRPLLGGRGAAILRHAKHAESPLIALPRASNTSTWTGLNPIVEHLVVHTDRPVMVVDA